MMKKFLNYLLILALVPALVLTSCKKDSEEETPANTAPVANAGIDQTVAIDAVVTLDGTASADADGNTITYLWTEAAGITLSDVSVAQPTFTAPNVTADTDFVFSLTVNDGTADSQPDEVTITVTTAAATPGFPILKDYLVTENLDLPALLDGWVIAPKMIADGGIVADDYTIPDYHVFDIRGEADFNAGHIKGSMNVALVDVLTEAANYTGKPILVVCYTGQTAGRAVMALRLSGYEAKVMKFGFSYWTSDTYEVGGEEKSFDKWSAKTGNIAVGHANWVTDASATLPVYNDPTWETFNTDGATILVERVDAMLANSEWGMSGETVLIDAPNYNIYNFWSNDHYLLFGHYKDAFQIKPISIDGDIIKAFPGDEEFMVYCYTGQTSSFTTAWLHVLGYNAKSIGFGVNGLSYTALEEYEPALGGVWHHSLEYDYEVTTK